MAEQDVLIRIYRTYDNWSRVSMGKIGDIKRYVDAMPSALEKCTLCKILSYKGVHCRPMHPLLKPKFSYCFTLLAFSTKSLMRIKVTLSYTHLKRHCSKNTLIGKFLRYCCSNAKVAHTLLKGIALNAALGGYKCQFLY